MIEKVSKAIDSIVKTLQFLLATFTLFTAIYGFFFWLPSFIKQKKVEKMIENGITNSKEALDILTNAEASLQRLHFLTKIKHDKELQSQTQFDASIALNKLVNSLLLLRRYPNIEEKIEWIKNLIKILDNTDVYVESKSSDILSQMDPEWSQRGKLNFEALEELRYTLLRIYESEERDY